MKYRIVTEKPDSAGDVRVRLEYKRRFRSWVEIHSHWAFKAHGLEGELILCKKMLTERAKTHKAAGLGKRTVEVLDV